MNFKLAKLTSTIGATESNNQENHSEIAKVSLEMNNPQPTNTGTGQSELSAKIEGMRRKLITTPIDYPVESIVNQIEDQTINLKSITDRPIYQREYFWSYSKASKLVESVLLNVPIPSCYFAEDEESKYDVIDGQQRILSLYKYLRDEFALEDLEALADIEGKKFSQLPIQLQRLIRNYVLRCVVITANSDPQIKFDVFERLNSDTTPLNAQELRNCIYRSEFNNMLGELAAEKLWLEIRNRKKPHIRMVDEELVLRFFSFYIQDRSKYKPPLKQWLNNAAALGKNFNSNQLSECRNIWHETIKKSLEWFEPHECFRRPNIKNFNRTLFDLVTYSVRKLDIQTIRSSRGEFRKRYKELVLSDEFNQVLTGPLGNRDVTIRRFNLWNRKFADLGL